MPSAGASLSAAVRCACEAAPGAGASTSATPERIRDGTGADAGARGNPRRRRRAVRWFSQQPPEVRASRQSRCKARIIGAQRIGSGGGLGRNAPVAGGGVVHGVMKCGWARGVAQRGQHLARSRDSSDRRQRRKRTPPPEPAGSAPARAVASSPPPAPAARRCRCAAARRSADTRARAAPSARRAQGVSPVSRRAPAGQSPMHGPRSPMPFTYAARAAIALTRPGRRSGCSWSRRSRRSCS